MGRRKKFKYYCTLCGKGFDKASQVKAHYGHCKNSENNAFLRNLRYIDILRLLYNFNAIRKIFSLEEIEEMVSKPMRLSNEIAQAMLGDIERLVSLKTRYQYEKRRLDELKEMKEKEKI